MSIISTYNIPLKDLLVGTHEYEYKLSQEYFDAIEGDLVKKGDATAKVVVKKTSQTFEISFKIDGVVQVPCDRCLEDMDQEIDTNGELIVKFGKEYEEESDKVIVIPEDEGKINVAWFIYEFIVLAVPIRHVHPIGKCSKSMVSKLRKHLARNADEDEEESEEDKELFNEVELEIGEEGEGEVETDTRWDKLKTLLNDNNN